MVHVYYLLIYWFSIMYLLTLKDLAFMLYKISRQSEPFWMHTLVLFNILFICIIFSFRGFLRFTFNFLAKNTGGLKPSGTLFFGSTIFVNYIYHIALVLVSPIRLKFNLYCEIVLYCFSITLMTVIVSDKNNIFSTYLIKLIIIYLIACIVIYLGFQATLGVLP